MVTLSQTKQLLAIFNAFYRHAFTELSEADAEIMATLWQRKLSPYDWEEVQRATDYITSTSKYMPSMAEFLEVIEQNRNPELRTPALEAWQTVIENVRRYGSYNWAEAERNMSARTVEVVRQLGWGKICMSDHREMDFIKRDFIELYNLSKQGEIQALIENHNNNIKTIENKTRQIEKGGA